MLLSVLSKLILALIFFAAIASPAGGLLDKSGAVIFLPRRLDNSAVAAEDLDLPARIEGKNLDLEITAKSAAVLDGLTGRILYEKDAYQKLPVASLTKLMTAHVFLKMNPDGRRTVIIRKEDDAPPAKIPVKEGEEIKVKDLFFSGLIASANNAIKAFTRLTGLSPFEYAQIMNKEARDWGLKDTQFVEPTGLDPLNQSTAYDMAVMVGHVFQNPAIRKATLLDKYSFQPVNSEKYYLVENTDKLLAEDNDFQITGGKTGYLEEAGYCLTVQAGDKKGHEIIAVVLGATSDEVRFREMKELINAVFESYRWSED